MWPAMEHLPVRYVSPLKRHAGDALRQARKLPVGHASRNDLRRLALGLLWLERKGLQTTDRVATILALEDLRS